TSGFLRRPATLNPPSLCSPHLRVGPTLASEFPCLSRICTWYVSTYSVQSVYVPLTRNISYRQRASTAARRTLVLRTRARAGYGA
ncbi:hypothetical protein L227DRAFT_579818, partial [Lentinus tigrinus ALCF2SS1-6]